MAYDDPRYGADRGDFDPFVSGGRAAEMAGSTPDDGTGYESPGYESAGYESTGYGAGYRYGEPQRESTRVSGTHRHAAVPPATGRNVARQRGTQSAGTSDVSVYGASGTAPGRDRIAVHLGWELVVAVGVLATAYLLRRVSPADLRGTDLRALLMTATIIGLAAVGVGLSLRAGVVNLAVGPVAYAAGLFFAEHSAEGLTTTGLTTIAIAVGAGALLAVVVVGLHVPAWAASLGLGLAAIAWISQRGGVANVVAGAYRPGQDAYYWFAGWAALAVLGAMLGLVRSIRQRAGEFRPVGDPAHRRGVAAASAAAAALIGSTVLAAAAGILLALDAGRVDPAENGLALTGLAVGSALLGGTSAFGRRGGIFGTALAVLLIVLFLRYHDAQGWKLTPFGVAAAAIAIGLVATRLIERFGGVASAWPVIEPVAAPEPQRSSPMGGVAAEPDPGVDSAWSSRSGGWASPLSARTTEQAWGEAERWPGR